MPSYLSSYLSFFQGVNEEGILRRRIEAVITGQTRNLLALFIGLVGSNPTVSAIKSLKTLGFQGLPLFLNQFSDMPKTQNGAHGARACGARPANEIFGIFLPWCPNGARAIKMDICRFMVVYRKKYTFFLRSKYLFDIIDK